MVGKLKFLVLVALCLSLTGAWPNTGKKYPTGGAAYSGPGDVVASAQAWYGLRAFNNTLANAGATTTPVMDVLGSTTATGCTIYLKGTGTGALDLTTSGAGGVGHQCASGATTFCTVTNASCSISKFYDQSGALQCGSAACNTTQATAADQPVFHFTGGPNNTAYLQCPNTTSSMTNGGFSGINQPITWVGVSYSGSAPNGQDVSVSYPLLQYLSTTSVDLYAGGASASVTITNAWHAFGALFNGASSIIYVDGTANSGLNANVQGTGATLRTCADGFSNASKAQLTEFGLWGSGLSGANVAALSTNAHNYYGF